MLKEAIEKIVELATPQTYEIDGNTYTTNRNLVQVIPNVDRPPVKNFSSLDAITQMIRIEKDRLTLPLIINVKEPDRVEVFTTYRKDNMDRDLCYVANAQLPKPLEYWNPLEETIIALRSRYIETEDSKYVINLLSQISDDNSVKSTDNGLTQTVNIQQGLSLQGKANVKPRVILRPYRTFLEVQQPESEFLLRLKSANEKTGEDIKISLTEADGGAWQLAAKKSIADYFREHLNDLIDQWIVYVTE